MMSSPRVGQKDAGDETAASAPQHVLARKYDRTDEQVVVIGLVWPRVIEASERAMMRSERRLMSTCTPSRRGVLRWLRCGVTGVTY